jgi:hypothetical protein
MKTPPLALNKKQRAVAGRESALLPFFRQLHSLAGFYCTVSVPTMYPFVSIGPIQPDEPVPQGSKQRNV